MFRITEDSSSGSLYSTWLKITTILVICSQALYKVPWWWILCDPKHVGSTFKYFIILIVSTYYILCISSIIKCLATCNYLLCVLFPNAFDCVYIELSYLFLLKDILFNITNLCFPCLLLRVYWSVFTLHVYYFVIFTACLAPVFYLIIALWQQPYQNINLCQRCPSIEVSCSSCRLISKLSC